MLSDGAADSSYPFFKSAKIGLKVSHTDGAHISLRYRESRREDERDEECCVRVRECKRERENM